MKMNRVYLATKSERAGHWINAVGFTLLALSGFNIHFAKEFNVFGTFSVAVFIHNVVGIVVSINYLLWWVYTIGRGRIRFFIPNRDDMPAGLIKQAKFYLFGIFKNAPHPFEEGVSRKFNPLQKWTYLGVMTVLLPIQVGTGLALFYLIHHWSGPGMAIANRLGVAHTIFAILGSAFLLGHIYLATTGDTPWAHFKMMFTGYAEGHSLPATDDQGVEQ